MSEFKLRSTGLHWREIDGEVIALEARESEYLAVNPAGTLLWRALANGASEAELAGLLVEAFGIEAATASRDVRAFVAGLREQGLVESYDSRANAA